MANQKPLRIGIVYSTVAFALFINAPRPVSSFLPVPLFKGNSPSRSLTAYLNPDIGSYAGGRDSFRNGTMKDLVIENEEIDIVGAGTLGDIMAESGSLETNNNADTNPSQTAVVDGLVTKEGGELNEKFGCNFTPMERIALTANGNLQRIFSSYYDAPIHVHVDSCVRRGAPSSQCPKSGVSSLDRFTFRAGADCAVWDRVVHLHLYDQTLCKATSIIHVRSPKCIQLIEEGTVGLGQLFRYLDKLPTFRLLDAGRTDEPLQSEFHGGIWRTYELQCEEMNCLIHEEFHRNAWDIFPTKSASVPFKPML